MITKPAAKRTINAPKPADEPVASFPNVKPDSIRHAFETGSYPYEDRLSRRDYEKQKAQLQAELLKVQHLVL